MKSKSKLIFNLHDFYSLCPSFNLIDSNGYFCNIPSKEKCNTCLKINSYASPSLHSNTSISSWRNLWHEFFIHCDEIVCFSESSRTLLLKAYKAINLKKIKVVPHRLPKDFYPSKILLKENKTMVIGVVGNIRFNKGSKILAQLAEEISDKSLDIKIVIIGSTDIYTDKSLINVTGEYNQKNLPQLITDSGANILFFPSIWPETFSYVVQELMHYNLPIACFNLGAPAERIASYKKGLIINSMQPKVILNNLVKFHRKIYG